MSERGGVGQFAASRSAVAGLAPLAGGGGLVIGRDRHQLPVVLRAFRPMPTRIVMVGGLAAAQLFVMRAMALGAQTLIQTSRPHLWTGFLLASGAPPDAAALAVPGGGWPFPTGSGRPQLVITDVGPVDQQALAFDGPQRTLVVLRDELTSWDVDALVGADLVIMQRLTEAEAAVAASALRLNQTRDWLPRISPEMIAVSEPGQLRWAVLSPTSIERQLFPSLARTATP